MRRAVLLVLLFAVCMRSFAAAVPVSRMQNAMSGVVQSKAQSRGFAANDPRIAGTLIGAGSVTVGAAASAAIITLAGVTAPAWITAAAGAGLTALIGYGVSLALDSAYRWIMNPDGTVTKVAANDPNVPAGAIAGQQYMYCFSNSCAPTAEGACNAVPATTRSDGTVSALVWTDGECHVFFKYTDGGIADLGKYSEPLYTAGVCAGIGINPVDGVCPASNFPVPAPQTSPVSDAVASIPAQEMAKPLNPQILADLANQAWQQAASLPGYNGLPYQATDPITAADVQAWESANPSQVPTVGDFVSPQAAPSGSSAGAPFSLPTASTPQATIDPDAPPSTGTNPAAENPLQNLGPDPGIGMPNLEPTPTVPMILDPIFSLMPSLRNFVVPQHAATCPTGTLHLFGGSQAFNAHCDLFESNRSLLAVIMAFVWGFVALRVTLSA